MPREPRAYKDEDEYAKCDPDSLTGFVGVACLRRGTRLAHFGSCHDNHPDHADADHESNGVLEQRRHLAALSIGKPIETRVARNAAVGLEAEQAERQLVLSLARIGNRSARALRTLSVRHGSIILERPCKRSTWDERSDLTAGNSARLGPSWQRVYNCWNVMSQRGVSAGSFSSSEFKVVGKS